MGLGLGLGLKAILKTAASSVLGNQMKGIVAEKVTSAAREKLGLPPEAPESDIETALAENPEIAAQMHQVATDLRIEQETTLQIAIQEQGLSERASLSSESGYIRNARPTMLYLGGLSCFAIICFGMAIAWFRPLSLSDFGDMVVAISMPLTALLTAGGVYAYRRTTDKATEKGMTLPPLFGGPKSG